MAKQKVVPVLNLSGVDVNMENVNKAKLVYRAFLHPLRKKILALLDSANGRSLNVTTIYTRLKIDQPVASQHLGILRKAGFVKAEREGKEILYSVNGEMLKTLNKASALLA